jgi:hypothetical protein
MSDIESLARVFFDAGATLGEALARSLAETHPELTAQVERALAHGERLVLSVEFDSSDPLVRLQTLDDYGNAKRLMEVRPSGPGSAH